MARLRCRITLIIVVDNKPAPSAIAETEFCFFLYLWVYRTGILGVLPGQLSWLALLQQGILGNSRQSEFIRKPILALP